MTKTLYYVEDIDLVSLDYNDNFLQETTGYKQLRFYTITSEAQLQFESKLELELNENTEEAIKDWLAEEEDLVKYQIIKL